MGLCYEHLNCPFAYECSHLAVSLLPMNRNARLDELYKGFELGYKAILIPPGQDAASASLNRASLTKVVDWLIEYCGLSGGLLALRRLDSHSQL